MGKFLIFLLLASCTLFGGVSKSQKKALADAALAAQKQAYAPYSAYQVGAALLTENGTIVQGCNVENASYGMTMCAERAATFSAVSQGERAFAALAVVTKDGAAPCGACRQVLNEFSPNLEIFLLDEKGNQKRQTTLTSLLPEAFGPQNLDTE